MDVYANRCLVSVHMGESVHCALMLGYCAHACENVHEYIHISLVNVYCVSVHV